MPQNRNAPASAAMSTPMPTFCTIIFAIDLCFCLFWSLVFLIGGVVFVVGLFSGSLTAGELFNGMLSMLIIGSIGVLGPIANAMLLLKKPMGLTLGYALAGAVVLTTLAHIVTILVSPSERAHTLSMAPLGVLVSTYFVRMVWLGMCIAALTLYSQWQARNPAARK